VICVLLVLLGLANLRLYHRPDMESAFAQLEFLERTLDRGAGERMQRHFPEGFVFTWALYGLAAIRGQEKGGRLSLSVFDRRESPLLGGSPNSHMHVRSAWFCADGRGSGYRLIVQELAFKAPPVDT